MNWVVVNKSHINAEHIDLFRRQNGELHIFFTSDKDPARWEDPDGELYRQLCRDLAINVIEED